MEGNYPVMLGQERVGTVHVRPQGLYHHFSCQCALSGEVMLELHLVWSEGSEKLGLLVPTGGEFGLHTQRSLRLPESGEVHFQLRPRHGPMKGIFCPVYPDEPFAYLRGLENAVMAFQGGQQGLILPNEK